LGSQWQLICARAVAYIADILTDHEFAFTTNTLTCWPYIHIDNTSMESSALTKAHEHVRTAATATFDSRVAIAGQEHDLAAGAFHEAVQDTHNAEVGTLYIPWLEYSNT
jgi:hypothetical protein